MRFALWLEANWGPLLSAHFKNPYDSQLLLVFADWMDENGASRVADAIRHILTGHNEKDSSAWISKASDLLVALWDELKREEVTFPSNTDSFKIGRNYYRVVQGSKERSIVKHLRTGVSDIPVPENKWTDTMVKAAMFIVLRHLASNRAPLGRHEDVFTKQRSTNLKERNIQGRLHHLSHQLNIWIMDLNTSPLWQQHNTITRALQQRLYDIGSYAQNISWLTTDVHGEVDPNKFRAEINTINTLIGTLVRDEVRLPANLQIFPGDMAWWLANPGSDDDVYETSTQV
jgi:uncharacterized protein (TIGR02996 family)